jgi:hypothetical protein
MGPKRINGFFANGPVVHSTQRACERILLTLTYDATPPILAAIARSDRAVTAQFSDLPDYHLLFGHLDQCPVLSDLSTEWRGTAEKAPAFLLVGLCA